MIDSIGAWNVLAADAGPSAETVSVSTFVIRSGSPKSPSSETITSSAGKIDSTA